MKIFHRHGPCFGITLFKWKHYRIEIWKFPSNYTIEKHSHPNENIEVLYLFGNATFYRIKPENHELVIWKSDYIPKFLSLPAGYIHWFIVGKLPLVAINFSRFLNGHESVSACEDFKLE